MSCLATRHRRSPWTRKLLVCSEPQLPYRPLLVPMLLPRNHTSLLHRPAIKICLRLLRTPSRLRKPVMPSALTLARVYNLLNFITTNIIMVLGGGGAATIITITTIITTIIITTADGAWEYEAFQKDASSFLGTFRPDGSAAVERRYEALRSGGSLLLTPKIC